MIVVPYVLLEGRTFTRRSYTRDEMSQFVSELSDKFEKLYLADEDGIRRNRPQLDVAQEACEEMPTLYEGGVRNASNVIDMLITGAEKCVVGTATLGSLEELRGAFKLSENITFTVDFRDGNLSSFDPATSGRAFLELSREVSGIGIADFVVPESLASEAMVAKKELGFSLGVIASVDRRASLERLGADYLVAEDYGRLTGND